MRKDPRYVENDFPLRSKVAIVVTSWDGHMPILQSSLESVMKTGAYVICSYDCKGKFPKPEIMKVPHSFVFKHTTYGASKRAGWLFDTVYAAGVLSKFNDIEVVFTGNSDCVWEKPEGMKECIKFLGKDCDMMAVSAAPNLIHTCSVMMKAYVYQRLADYIVENLKNNVPESYSPEVILRDFVKHYDIKHVPAPIQPMFPEGNRYKGVDHYCSYNQDSTWKRVLGFRNIGAEHKQASLQHLEPPKKNFFDFKEKFSAHEMVLLKYYKTNDRRWLYKYWAEGEDSFWNRRYYPIEYYGSKPLHDDSKRKTLGPPSERLGFFDYKEYQSFILKDELYYSKWKAFIEGKNKE